MSQTKLENAKKILSITLSVDIAVTALIVITNFWAVAVVKNVQVTHEIEKSTVKALDFWESFSVLGIVAVICVGLALVRWLGGCYEFARDTLKSTGFSQEKWRISGWIIPFLNLFKPYQVINEIHKVSVAGNPEGEKWKNSSGSGMLLTWWIFWAITHLILWSMVKYSFRISFQDDLTLNQAIELYHISTFVCIISLVISILWLFISGGMTRRLLNHSVPAQDSVKQIKPVVTSAREASFSAQKDVSTSSQGENSPTNRNTIKSIPIQISSHSDTEKSGLNITDETQVNESELYEQVWKEIEKNETDIGLWAECFAHCEGDENKTKALYVNKRVLVLKEELKKQKLDQEREAKKQAEEEMKKNLESKDKAKRMLIFEGRTDNIEIFKETLHTMPNFFPNILNHFGYKLVHNKDRQEMWSIHFPNEVGAKHVYNLFDLRTELRKIVINNSDTDGKNNNGKNDQTIHEIQCSLCNTIVKKGKFTKIMDIMICNTCQTALNEKSVNFDSKFFSENKLIFEAMQAFRNEDYINSKYHCLLLQKKFPESPFWSYPNGEKLKKKIMT